MKKILLLCSTFIAAAITTHILADITINNKTGEQIRFIANYSSKRHTAGFIEPNTSKSFSYIQPDYPSSHITGIMTRKTKETAVSNSYISVQDNDTFDVTKNNAGQLQIQKQ